MKFRLSAITEQSLEDAVCRAITGNHHTIEEVLAKKLAMYETWNKFVQDERVTLEIDFARGTCEVESQ